MVLRASAEPMRISRGYMRMNDHSLLPKKPLQWRKGFGLEVDLRRRGHGALGQREQVDVARQRGRLTPGAGVEHIAHADTPGDAAAVDLLDSFDAEVHAGPGWQTHAVAWVDPAPAFVDHIALQGHRPG